MSSTTQHAAERFIKRRAISEYVSSADIDEAHETHEGVATRTSRSTSQAVYDALTGRIGEIKFEQMSDLELWRYGDEDGNDEAYEADYIKLATGDLIDVKTKTPNSNLNKVYISMANRHVDDLVRIIRLQSTAERRSESALSATLHAMTSGSTERRSGTTTAPCARSHSRSRENSTACSGWYNTYLIYYPNT